MAALKKLILGFVILVVTLSAIGLILPKHYNVERSIVINAGPDVVYPEVVNLKAWPTWGVWFKRDPAMELIYSGPDRAIGMRSEWKSVSEGNGEMEITALEHNKKVVYSLYFPDMDMGSTGTIEFVPSNSGTRVVWRDEGEVGNNPVDRYVVLMIDSLLGPDFEAGLENLKVVVENRG